MRAILLLASLLLLPVFSLCEDGGSAQAPEADTVCTFGDGQQLSVRYLAVPFQKGTKLTYGKVWTPGNRPMYLFTQTGLSFGSTSVAPGAYSLFVIPGEDNWTLAINKNVEKDAAYDSKQDVTRFKADTGTLPNKADALNLYFGRLSPTKCTLRIDYGKQRAFADFQQK